jgi:hypothetical protein
LIRRAMTVLVVVQAYPDNEVQAYPNSEIQGYPDSELQSYLKSDPAAPDRLTKSEIQQISDIILASLESESLDSSTWENIATHAQKAINSICTIVFPLIVFPLIVFFPQIPTAPSLPLPDVDDIEWQRFTQGDNLAAELLCNIIKADS